MAVRLCSERPCKKHKIIAGRKGWLEESQNLLSVAMDSSRRLKPVILLGLEPNFAPSFNLVISSFKDPFLMIPSYVCCIE